MKIYLDSRDLIDMFDKSLPYSADDFENELRTNGHELVLSFSNVMEISSPLLTRSTKTNVMRLLKRIEEMPLKFIAEARILILELNEAKEAFIQEREYSQVHPFVDRFDKTLIDPRSTKTLMNFSLAEAIFMLWTEDPSLFRGMRSYTKRLQEVFTSDRAVPQQPNLRDHFVEVIGRHLKGAKLLISSPELRPFAEWIYENPMRCPSVRLSYEVYHKLLKNIEDLPDDGDIYDLAHIACIPYVDIATLDRRMSSYVRQACGSIKTGYEIRICTSMADVLSRF